MIVAAAGTLVLIAGGIDLSVGAVYALAGATATQLAATGSALGDLARLAVGSWSASPTGSSSPASASTR